jgi:excisionase family DNA binding protein
VNASQPSEKITETDPPSVQPSQALAENPKNFTTRLLPGSGARQATRTTTPTLADLGVLYSGRDRLLSVSEVAEHLGVSTATVYKICKRGDLPHVRIIDSIRIRPSDVAAFADTRQRQTTPSANASAICPSRPTSYSRG